MSQRPNRAPSFCTDPAPGALVEFPSGIVSAGFTSERRPAAQWMNYAFNLWGGWINFLRGASPTNWTRRTGSGAAASWDAAVSPAQPVFVAIDTTTPEREVAPSRYVAIGKVGGFIEVWCSTRATEWVNRSAAMPGTFIAASIPRGVHVGGGRWAVLTAEQVFTTPRDTAAGLSATAAGGPSWVLGTTPGGGISLEALAYDVGTSTWALAYNVAGPAARFAYSLDGGITFAAAGITAGPPTGSACDIAWTGLYFVAITATGQVWRSTGSGGNFALANTLPASTKWKLAVAPGLLVAYELGVTATRIYTSTDDGTNWTLLTVPSGVRNLTRLIYADGAWVASASDAPYVWTSNDLGALSWVRAVLPHPETADAIYALAYGEGALLAMGRAAAYTSHRAADAGPGPADGLAGTIVLADAAYLQSNPIDAGAPASGDVLTWTGSKWAPVAPSGGGGGGTPYAGTPAAVAASGSAGASSDYARGDHVHAHGNQTVDTMHALAVASVSHGFFDKADKAKLDGFGAASGYALLAGATFTGNIQAPQLSLSGSGLTSTGSTVPVVKPLEVTVDDATTNNITACLKLSHTTSGTAAAGIGAALLFGSEDASGNAEDVAYIAAVLSTATNGAEASRIDFATRSGGGANTVQMRLFSDGSLTLNQSTAIGGAGRIGFPNTGGLYFYHSTNGWTKIVDPTGNDLTVGTATTSRTTWFTSTGIITNYASGGVTSWTPMHRFGDYAQTKYFVVISDGEMIAGAGDATTVPASFRIRGPNSTASNATGPNITLRTGLGTGTGTPGSIVIEGGEKNSVGGSLASHNVVELGRFQDSDTDNETAFLVRIRKSGVESVVRVEIGAADSGGTGKRALVIPN